MSRPAFSRILSPSTLHVMTIINIVLLVGGLILGSVCIWDITTHNKTNHGNLQPIAVSGNILFVIYGINTIFQIYFGSIYLWIGVENRDLDKTRSWFAAGINLLALEILNVVFISFMSPTIEYFMSLSMILIMYKFFILWPVESFITDLESCLRPLMDTESQFHI